MRLDAEQQEHRQYSVWHVGRKQRLDWVVWVDTDAAQYAVCRQPLQAEGGMLVLDTHRARRIEILPDAKLVLIYPETELVPVWPEGRGEGDGTGAVAAPGASG